MTDLQYYSGIEGNAGAAILSQEDDKNAKIKGIIDFIGSNLQPMDCFMTMRGLKTLSLRIEQ